MGHSRTSCDVRPLCLRTVPNLVMTVAYLLHSFWTSTGQTSVAFAVGAVGTVVGTIFSYAALKPWLGAEGYKACCITSAFCHS